jgi:predicted  nucleic acid-binding Zn-ribbon protein
VNKRNKYPLKKILSEIEIEIGKQLNKLNPLTKSKIIKMDNCLKIITSKMEEKINSKHRKKLELQEYYQKILKTIKNKLLKIYLSI